MTVCAICSDPVRPCPDPGTPPVCPPYHHTTGGHNHAAVVWSSGIQTDPSRCWVRIDHPDNGGHWSRRLIGDAWALEPFGDPNPADEFSLTITLERVSSSTSAGMRLTREEGLALHTALGQWLERGTS